MRLSELIWVWRKGKYFCKRGWTGHFGKHEVICPSGGLHAIRLANASLAERLTDRFSIERTSSVTRAHTHKSSLIAARCPICADSGPNSASQRNDAKCQKRTSANHGVTETLRGDSVPASKPDQDACLRTLANSWFR
jgi:hypothetical protein